MSGFRVDAPSGTLTISPAVKQPACRLPFAASTGWGAYSHESGIGGGVRSAFTATLECRSGKLEFRTLRLGAAPAGGTLSATLYGKKIACEGVEVGGVVEVRFKKTVKMGEGDAMRVRVGKE